MAFTPSNSTKNTSPVEKQQIDGIVSAVTFFSEETGYYVADVLPLNQRRSIQVVGYAQSLFKGEQISIAGEWVDHEKHGPQFKAIETVVSPPANTEGLEKYLSSGILPGIGEAKASRLVRKYGNSVIEVLENEPESVADLVGLKVEQLYEIGKILRDRRASSEVFIFLHGLGVSPSKAKLIWDNFGDQTRTIIANDPYLLAEINGIGFVQADQIAKKLLFSPSSPKRVHAAISYVLKSAVSSGSCGFPMADVVSQVMELISGTSRTVIAERIQECLDFGTIKQSKIDNIDCLFHRQIWLAEKDIANKMHKLITNPNMPWALKITTDFIEAVAKKSKIQLSDEQLLAVKNSLTSGVSVITGGPGTGKSTITKVIVGCLEALNVRYSLSSPTGIAAKRLASVTSRDASTMHRLLGYKPNGEVLHNESKPLLGEFFIVDETSMVDVYLMKNYIKAIKDGASLLLIGDVDQLPSVGVGAVLRDIIKSGVVPCSRLSKVFRQAAVSEIVSSAHKINSGQMPLKTDPQKMDGDFWLFEMEDRQGAQALPERMLEATIRGVRKLVSLGYDPIKEVQVLAPMQNGVLGVINLNEKLRIELNPGSLINGYNFKVGDKVIQTINDYEKEVFNGEVGYVSNISRLTETFDVEFLDGRSVIYSKREQGQLSLAYALTIHKSQGSEFPAVLMVLSRQHHIMLKRNLVYTGLTRAKKQAVILTQKGAMNVAVSNNNIEVRYSLLESFLKDLLNPNNHNKHTPNI